MQLNIKTIQSNFLLFLELQLLISIFTLPILIAWGLPVSVMNIAGNLIFAHFLTMFIGVAALLFTTTLLNIPNFWIAKMLEYITEFWDYCLSFSSSAWLIGFPIWLFPISLLFACGTYQLYTYTNIPQKHKVMVLSLFCIIPFMLKQIDHHYQYQTTITQGSGKLHIIKVRNKVYAFDVGALEARPCSKSWIEYTLLPHLIKTMGIVTIDTLIICRSNSRTKQALIDLNHSIPITNIIYLRQAIPRRILSPASKILISTIVNQK